MAPDLKTIAENSPFNLEKVQGLYEIFNNVSSKSVTGPVLKEIDFLRAASKSDIQVIYREFMTRLFEVLDEDTKGYLDFVDFIKALATIVTQPLIEEFKYAFRLYDLNNKGFLGKMDVRAMVTLMRTAAPDERTAAKLPTKIDRLFKRMDMDDDGIIDEDDWLRFLTSKRKGRRIIHGLLHEPLIHHLSAVFPRMSLQSCLAQDGGLTRMTDVDSGRINKCSMDISSGEIERTMPKLEVPINIHDISPARHAYLNAIAACTSFTVTEIKDLYVVFINLSRLGPHGMRLTRDHFQREGERILGIIGGSQFEFIGRLFDLLDVRRKGYLNFMEFAATLSVLVTAVGSSIEKEAYLIDLAFHVFDLKGQKFLDQEDFERTQQQMKWRCFDVDRVKADIAGKVPALQFSVIDIDGDGRIDLEEWRMYFQAHPELLHLFIKECVDTVVAIIPSAKFPALP